jgi:hypothetical protein
MHVECRCSTPTSTFILRSSANLQMVVCWIVITAIIKYLWLQTPLNIICGNGCVCGGSHMWECALMKLKLKYKIWADHQRTFVKMSRHCGRRGGELCQCQVRVCSTHNDSLDIRNSVGNGRWMKRCKVRTNNITGVPFSWIWIVPCLNLSLQCRPIVDI